MSAITDERLAELIATYDRLAHQSRNSALGDERKEVSAALRELQQLRKLTGKLLAHCPDPECMECAKACCPHGEPLHFHHDGCPACYSASA